MKFNKKRKGSLRVKFLEMTVIPIVILGIIITLASFNSFTKNIYKSVERDLKDEAYTILNVYDLMFPGDYEVVQSDTLIALKKGNEYISDKTDLIKCVNEDTGLDISIIYGSVRMITSLSGSDGRSLVGTKVNPVIAKEVMDSNQEKFYESIVLDGKKYLAYYVPIHNSDGSVVGMLAVTKTAAAANALVRKAVTPTIIIAIVCTCVAVYFTIMYSNKIIGVTHKLKGFLEQLGKGMLGGKIEPEILKRNDEFGEMAQAAVNMQKSLCILVERDHLTQMYNRRYAIDRLNRVYIKSGNTGLPFAVAIGDIDYFKCVNDTYGHDAGDLILKSVADTINSFMAGKGFAARWGGEEFLLVFEKNDCDTAETELYRLLDMIHTIAVDYKDQIIKVNMSIGVANGYGRDIEQTLKKSDERLYYAKEHGRNQIVGNRIE